MPCRRLTPRKAAQIRYRAEARQLMSAQRLINPKKNLQRAGYPHTQARCNYGFQEREKACPLLQPTAPTYPTTVRRQRPSRSEVSPAARARLVREQKLGKEAFAQNMMHGRKAEVKDIVFGGR